LPSHTGVIQFVNESALDVWGFSLAEVVGRSINMMMPERYANEHDGYMTKFLATGQSTVFGHGRNVPIKLKNQEEVQVRLSVTKKKDEKNEFIYTGIVQIL
jgi:PAS domain S-box-containing protein